MNIVIVTNTYPPHASAAARSVETTAAEYRRQGHRVLVIAPEFDGAPADETDTVRLPAIPPLFKTKQSRGSDFAVSVPLTGTCKRALDEFQPDIVHSFQPFLLGATALRVSVAWEIPLVFSHNTRYEYGYAPDNSPRLQRFVAELAVGYCELADSVIVPTARVAAALKNRDVATPLEVIPPGVDVEQYQTEQRTELRQGLGIPADAFVAGHVGPLASEQDATFLARLLRDFLRKHADSHVLLAGNRNYQETLRQHLRRDQTSRRVHEIAGLSRNDLAAAYDAMDAMLVPTRVDTNDSLVLEALAAGTPVVAADSPDVRGLIRDGENGRLLTNASRSKYIAALEELAALDNVARAQLSAHARATAELFSLQTKVERTIALYERLVASHTPPKDIEESGWEAMRRQLDVEWQLWSKRTQAAGYAFSGRHPPRVPVLRHVIHWWRRFRSWFSRREWSVKLLDLPVSEGTSEESGLILLQIDGLSRNQFEHALRKGRMPFLARLIRRENYRPHTMYSGQPTTTPAVLGELYYGVEQAVPAFGFRDHRTGKVVEMFHPGIASTVQHELSQEGEGLLEEGSAYSVIYSGGAEQSSFCPATTGWRNIEDVTMWRRVVLFLMNLMSLARIALLSVAEFFVAIGDCIRGIIKGREFWREVLYIPRRVIVNVVLRELIGISVEVDVTRGVRVIHANFLGYDENAHRRGPGAWFAHYTLRGIDRAVRRIWNAAHASTRRDYHLWIMSDHGQQRTIPYTHEYGREIGPAVAAIYRDMNPAADAEPASGDDRGQEESRAELRRANWLRAKSTAKEVAKSWFDWSKDESGPSTVAIGPIGYVYWPDSLQPDDYDSIARRLIADAGVPLVLAAVEKTVWAWNAEGKYHMPDEAAQILPADHPHLAETAKDLAQLCFHKDAGDFLISGWRNDKLPISFVPENGAHGGPGPEETSGFVLLPPDAPLPDYDSVKLRPLGLRNLALDLLGRQPLQTSSRPRREPGTLRLVTYNVHSCIGMDGRLSPTRIARILAATSPDIVALQELDVHRSRSGFVDQAREVAHALNMQLHFHPSFDVEEESYGNAILSRFPMHPVQAGPLPCSRLGQEPRGAMWVEIIVNGTPLQVINTHLGLSPAERQKQIDELLGPDWLGQRACREPVILCGDFNAGPRSLVYRQVTRRLRDVQAELADHSPRATWYARLPMRRIDHIFVSETLQPTNVLVPRTQLARAASDHLPLIVDLDLSRTTSAGHREEQKDDAADRPEPVESFQ